MEGLNILNNRRNQLPGEKGADWAEKKQNGKDSDKRIQTPEKVTEEEDKENPKMTDGKWVLYERGSEPKELVELLEGRVTGWRIEREKEATDHSSTDYFRVYYSYDKDGNPTVPSLCISEQDGMITEIRGVTENRDIDEHIQLVLGKELEDLGEEGEWYRNALKNTKHFADIHKKHTEGEVLTVQNLKFLYGFGDFPFPESFDDNEYWRIKEIKGERNQKADISRILNIPADRISLTREEALSGNMLYHYGDFLDLHDFTSAPGIILPKRVGGILYLNSLRSAENLTLPERVDGSLHLDTLRSPKGLILPKIVGGSLALCSLTSVENLTLPEVVGECVFIKKNLRDDIEKALPVGKVMSDYNFKFISV